MVKRKLDENEVRITNKNLKLHKDDLEYLKEVMLPQKELAIKTAPVVVKKQLSDLESEKKAIIHKIDELENIVKISEKQLKEGVEVKDIKTDSEKEVTKQSGR